jgi:hypothetical protein
MNVARLWVLRTCCLYSPGNIPGTHFCSRLSWPQGHSVARRTVSMKNLGIKPMTFWLVAVPQPTAPLCAPQKIIFMQILHDWWKWFADHTPSGSHNFRNIMLTTLFKRDQNSISNGHQYCFLYMCSQNSCLIQTDNKEGAIFHWIKAWFKQLSLTAWNRVESR